MILFGRKHGNLHILGSSKRGVLLRCKSPSTMHIHEKNSTSTSKVSPNYEEALLMRPPNTLMKFPHVLYLDFKETSL